MALALLWVGAVHGIAHAQNNPFGMANVPFTDADPVMDGRATSNPEWARATRLPDTFFFGGTPRSGFYYFQNRLDWLATSVQTAAQRRYTGTTFFVAHDIIGSADPANGLHQFRVNDNNDWNSFEFAVPGGKAMIWVFDDVDDPDDSDWLPFSDGLDTSSRIPEGSGANRIDDRGFIARLNDNPATDVHWFEGMPEPGDAGWDWAAWHYVFGRHHFGKSFQDVLLDTDPENNVNHEVYEFCAFRPDWTQPPPPPPPPPPWCIWWDVDFEEEIVIEHLIVIRDGRPVKATRKVTKKKPVPILRGQFWLHFWDPVLFPTGNPTDNQHALFILNQLAVLAEETPGNAGNYLQMARMHLQAGCGLMFNGQNNDALKEVKEAAGFLQNARRMGVNRRDLVNLETQYLSLFAGEAAKRVMELDQELPMTDKRVQKAYAALDGFGEKLRQAAEKPKTFDALKTLQNLKPVYQVLDTAFR